MCRFGIWVWTQQAVRGCGAEIVRSVTVLLIHHYHFLSFNWLLVVEVAAPDVKDQSASWNQSYLWAPQTSKGCFVAFGLTGRGSLYNITCALRRVNTACHATRQQTQQGTLTRSESDLMGQSFED